MNVLADAMLVNSKGRDVEVPVLLKTVEPMDKEAVLRDMVVATSTVMAFTNSSKSRELEVTSLPAVQDKRPAPLFWRKPPVCEDGQV